ncbi:MAG TPA: NAD(P)-dependent oxidoreductase, partial [Anaerolineae bacterium]|nr:NAD(P)-dependent oxidoreductase [Anaerolineae bacterium]
GSGIARNILKVGFPLTVYNRTQEKAVSLLDAGAQWAESPAAAAEQADVIISVVSDDDASREVWLGSHGALPALRSSAVAIECGTLSLDWIRQLHAYARDYNVVFIDAPLGGSRSVAESGTLTLFIGAEDAALEIARPVLSAFATNLMHFGPPTSGAAYKLINNLQGALHLLALGEGVALAERAGLNMQTVAQAITSGAAASPMVKGKIQNVITRHYDDVNFALRWMHKDLTYALRAADELGVPMPMVAAARELFRMAMQQGKGDLDFGAVTEVIRG